MNRYLCTSVLLAFLGICSVSCKKTPVDTLFEDLPSTESGVSFSNDISSSEEFNMIDYLYYYDGGGVAIGDINNDGLSDIYLVSNEGENGLFLNQGDMKFLDISESAGVKSPGLWKTGVSMADVNGDGLLDIYLCRLGHYKGVEGKNELYINQGDLTFKEEAARYNLDFSGFSTQAAFFDMDNDNDLDLYLLNHSVHGSHSFGASSLRSEVDTLSGDRLYRNDHQYFTDISSGSGIYRSQLGYGLGIGLSDINRDGFTDIFVANDFMEQDYLYLNNQDGTFTDIFSTAANHTSLSSMGCDLADYNNDGLTDIVVLDMLPQQENIRKSTVGEDPEEIFRMKLNYGYLPQYKRNTLQLNMGNNTFSEIAMMAGIHATDWSWAPLLADFDNDGWKDLFVSNGIKGRPNDLDYLNFINREEILNNPHTPDSILLQQMPSGKISNYFYRNKGDLTFKNTSEEWGVIPNLITQGVAYGDLDNDGDLDLVLNNTDTLAVIKVNNASTDTTTHYLGLHLTGIGENTKAIGAKVQVYHDGQHQFFEVYPVRGFKSSVDSRLHIGLGSSSLIDSLRIDWPGGGTTDLYDIDSDRILSLVQPQSEASTSISPILNQSLFVPESNEELGVDYLHSENTFIEFNREPLIPHMHSQEGPAVAVADINNDGLDDFFVGGAKHQPGSIYLQIENGFMVSHQPALEEDKITEDVDGVFLDFDKDGDLDLVVVSGGNEFQDDSPNRQPRLYVNDGKGSFNRFKGIFDGVYQTGSCVAVYDFDQDGWPDLFFGSLAVPWNYGIAPKSYLLKNDEGQSFLDVSHYLPNDGVLGMINDAEWIDLDGRGNKTLVLAGEWMDITMLSFQGSAFKQTTIPESSGWWKAIDHFDYDGDGDQDILAGNMGLNSKLKTHKQKPVNLYLEDIDQNGKLDAIITYFSKGQESVFTTKEILERQIPSIASRFPSSKDFAEANPNQILGQAVSQSKKLSVKELRSGVFINDGQGFHFEPFSNLMQTGFIQDFLIADVDEDGSPDILSAGNLFSSSMQEGRYDANYGGLLKGPPHKGEIMSSYDTGIYLKGDMRSIESLIYQGKELLMGVRNNDTIIWFKRR